ncbi:MAG: zinc ribbon domain-containing protein [Gemmatimonadaceae bacterium]|nr:zinc ribbon domain-containing protein [Gemmatimonadaceae bacterium]
MPDRTASSPRPCPSCAADVRGTFCPKCGTLARETPCPSCSATLAPGARFCEECGAAVGASPVPGAVPLAREDWRPSTGWKIGVGTLALLLAVTLYLRFSTDRAPAGAPFATAGMQGAPLGGPSANVLSMPPQQQADALFDRVMRLSEEGKRDSVQFFAPMAMSVYEQLQPLDLDQRFDLGTIALAAGDTRVARAQADSILQSDPDHLLGLALMSRTGRASGAAADAERADARFRQAAEGELRKSQEKPEYQRHRADIETELKRLAGLTQ